MVFEISDHPWINHVPVKMWRVQNGCIHQPLESLAQDHGLLGVEKAPKRFQA